MMLTTSGEAGYELGEEQFFIGSFAVASRVASGGVRNALLDLGGRYYLRQSEHRVFFAGFDATYSSHLDEDTQLLLGGDNGLRGYPLRFQAGTSRAVMTLEQRFYTDWQPLRLANVGAALFADTGRMWGQDRFAAAPQGWAGTACRHHRTQDHPQRGRLGGRDRRGHLGDRKSVV